MLRPSLCTFSIPVVLAFAAPIWSAGAVTAQTESKVAANRFVPADSCFVMRFAAPAKWRDRFATTQVAKLGQSEALAPLLEGLRQQYEAGLEELRSSGEFDADLVERFVGEYRGDVVLSFQIGLNDIQQVLQRGGKLPFALLVALTPDGAFDLGALTSAIEQASEKHAPAEAKLHDLTIGDTRLRLAEVGADDAISVALPAMVDGSMVMAIGRGLEDHLEAALAAEKRFTGDVGADRPFHVHDELEPLMKALIDSTANNQLPFDPADIMTAIGLKSLRGLTVSFDAQDQRVAGEMRLGMAAKQRGLLQMLVPGTQKPKLLAAVPPTAEAWSVSSMSFAPVFDTVRTVWSALDEVVPMTFDDAMAAFTEAAKVRLKEDLIDHLGNELLMIQDAESLQNFAADDGDNPFAAMMSDCVYGVALKNGAAFGESLEKALRARGMHAGRKTEDYGTAKINQLRLGGLVQLEYVVTDDLLLLGIGKGEGTQRALRSVLDAKKSGDGGVPAAFAAQVAELPGGWNGASMTPVAAVLHAMAAAFEAGAEEVGPDAHMVAEVARSMARDLKRLGLATMVSTTYVDDSGLVSRFRW